MTELEKLRNAIDAGTSTFSDLRKTMIYVDKTEYMHHLLSAGEGRKYYFLSRPRRFGKSLLLSTLKSLFNGEEELFRGLYIHDKWDWTNTYPVIHLDISGVEGSSKEMIYEKLIDELAIRSSLEHEIDINTSFLPEKAFRGLIGQLYKKHKKKVVILIDEYDHPILNHITNYEKAEQARKLMASFYQVVKQMDEYIRFVFITGVSKFTKVSIFSKLNNLRDISLEPKYSAICGYTESEIERYFGPLLDQFKAKYGNDFFRQKYNGYNWLGEKVYNPIDAGKALESCIAEDYWFETGATTFLTETLQKRGFTAPALNSLEYSNTVFEGLSLQNVDDTALLFQTGYLTIENVIEDFKTKRRLFQLNFPNDEVRYAYLQSLFVAWLPDDSYNKNKPHFVEIGKALAVGDIQQIGQCIENIFASFSYTFYQQEGNKMHNYEAFYTAVVAGILAGISSDIVTEGHTPKGRIDLYVRKDDLHYIFEMKVIENSGVATGVEQIIKKGYADKYRQTGRKLYLVGIDFTSTRKSIESIYYQLDGDTELQEMYMFTKVDMSKPDED